MTSDANYTQAFVWSGSRIKQNPSSPAFYRQVASNSYSTTGEVTSRARMPFRSTNRNCRCGAESCHSRRD